MDKLNLENIWNICPTCTAINTKPFLTVKGKSMQIQERTQPGHNVFWISWLASSPLGTAASRNRWATLCWEGLLNMAVFSSSLTPPPSATVRYYCETRVMRVWMCLEYSEMKLMLTKMECNSTATHWEISFNRSPCLVAVGTPFKGTPLFHGENYFFKRWNFHSW